MALVNRRKISLYDEAKAGFSSLVQQTAQVGLGLLVILLLTGGNPPGFIVALSFFGGIGFVAWREKQRLSQTEQLPEEQPDRSRSVDVDKQQFTQSEQSLKEPQNSHTVTKSSKKALYNKNQVRITRNLLEYRGTEYQIRNICQVLLEKELAYEQSLSSFTILAFLLIAAALYFFDLPELIILGAILVLLWIFNPTEVEPTYKLIVTTNQGEVITLEPKNSDDLKQMKAALEKAIDMSDERSSELMDERKT
ncbi:DUF6232 family protein [Microseira sp. BLCC-F43]|jgi:hypothetical protein|uniref:DUF6232 family protein n=1 Tax=Microseira sp. BLCC-F43 TaxID=3153602 RepID=UPI0035B86448